MEEYKRVKFNDEYWSIIKLDKDEKKALKKSFAVSQSYPSRYWQEHHLASLEERVAYLKGTTDELNGLKEYHYEGLFDTELECYYHIKCVELEKRLEGVYRAISDINGSAKLPSIGWFGIRLEYADLEDIIE